MKTPSSIARAFSAMTPARFKIAAATSKLTPPDSVGTGTLSAGATLTIAKLDSLSRNAAFIPNPAAQSR